MNQSPVPVEIAGVAAAAEDGLRQAGNPQAAASLGGMPPLNVLMPDFGNGSLRTTPLPSVGNGVVDPNGPMFFNGWAPNSWTPGQMPALPGGALPGQLPTSPTASVPGPAAPAQAVEPLPPTTAHPSKVAAPPVVKKGKSALTKATLISELNRLQLKTMEDLVKNVDVGVGDMNASGKFLYLTNSMASDLTDMYKVRDRLDLGQPSMVIRLMPSHLGSDWWKAFHYWSGRFPAKQTPQPNADEEEVTDHKMLLFCKEVVLPLAIANRALVLGQEACGLTTAFVKVSSKVQSQFGNRRPFRLIIFARAYVFNLKARDPTTLAHQFRKRSQAWTESDEDFEVALQKRYGDDPAFWPRLDLFPGRYSIIVFECLSNGLIHEEAMCNFQNAFISALSDVPVIALQTYGTDYMNFLPSMTEFVSMGWPLMLLDSRPRNARDCETMEDAVLQLNDFSEQLHAAGVADWYSTDIMAFVKAVVSRAKRREKRLHLHSKDRFQRNMWIHEAILELRTSKELRDITEDVLDAKNSVQKGTVLINKHEKMIVDGADAIMGYVGAELEWEYLNRHERFREAISNIQEATTWFEFRTLLDENWQKVRGCCFHLYKHLKQFVDATPWAKLTDHGEEPNNKWFNGRFQLTIDPSMVVDVQDKDFLEESKQAVLDLFDQEFSFSSNLDRKSKSKRVFVSQEEKWVAVYEILKSKNVSVGNIHDLTSCGKILSDLTQIDYLPNQNSLEALVLLRRAWTLYEYYMVGAAAYKRMSKTAYLAMLTLQSAMVFVVTSMAVLEKDADAIVAPGHKKAILLGLSLLCTFITGYTTMCSPVRKWHGLRGAAMKIESEIWKFRTRQGEYMAQVTTLMFKHEAEREAERKFARSLTQIVERVQQGASLNNTTFFSKPTTDPDTVMPLALDQDESWSSYYMKSCSHGQFKVAAFDAPPGSGQDNFHSPQIADDYVRNRLMPARDFYQGRIPHYARMRIFFQIMILISTMINALVAAVTNGELTALIASIAGFLAAWQEFTGVEKKLDSYSTVARQLEELALWWQALPDEEKRNMKNIEVLIGSTEMQITGQLAAWLSHAQSLTKAVPKDKNQEAGDEEAATETKKAS